MGGDMKIPMLVLGGAAGGTTTTEMTSTNQNVKAKDGKILEMQKSGSNKTEKKEMVIPIQIEGRPAIEKPKTPRPRMLPFEFPGMSMAMPSMTMDCSMPNMQMPGFSMQMSSAADMMAQMQAQVQQQMSQMQSFGQIQMESVSSSQQEAIAQAQATQAVQSQVQQQMSQQTQQAAVETAQ